eukprot:gnl/TRDRNA2_/TRDRNA2_41149_c0_seq1.p1 gnl/TRDRNA2_/TRDRNA2_41149_c0~~gnl/TRDRNA2_/TRDRNA2_41149_c0_seq1.p1  ORF type:complete len:136 (-),score=12.88 gnl/TRDRNA2_/TRDRNA2_41149_c0_seq1:278-685(-)
MSAHPTLPQLLRTDAHGTGDQHELIMVRHAIAKEELTRRISQTSPPNTWPGREAKLACSAPLDTYYPRGLPHERNNDSRGVYPCVLPDPKAPLWPPPRKTEPAHATPRKRPGIMQARGGGLLRSQPAGRIDSRGA